MRGETWGMNEFGSLGKRNFEFQDAWSSRLSSPVLQKVDLEKFFFDVERKFNTEKRGSAVDVDIFANKASPDDEGQLEHLEELVGVVIYSFSLTGNV